MRASMQAQALDAGTPPSEYLGGRISARHPVFGTRPPPSARTRQRYDLLKRIVADAHGAGLNAVEIYRRLDQQGTPLAMSALYRDLRELTERGRLRQEWLPRGGHLAAVYRLMEAPRATASRLVCRACASSVDLPDPEALARVVAEICGAQGMSVSAEPLEVQVLCRSCEQLRAKGSRQTRR